jgi:radical SAM protein with 4Fe4S-binding SPASM domain
MTINDPVITHSGLHPDYSEEMKYFKENKVYTVQIETTLACPQSCLFCYASQKDAPLKELSSEKIISVLDTASAMGIKAIDWLGGDPLVRADWYELMSYSKALGMRNNIWTSGIPLSDKTFAIKAVEMTENGFISVHLDSLNENIYGQLHNGDSKNNIQAILAGVDNILSLGKNPNDLINCITFTKLSAGEDVEKTIKYFFEEKGIRTCLTQMCMVGSAEEHQEWLPTAQDIRNACEARDRINYSNSQNTISTMDVNKFYCGGTICVTVDGDVTPCSVIRKGFGNINDSSLEEIVRQAKNELLLIPLRDQGQIPGHCGSCANNSVCWGCRALSYYDSGDIMAEDPKCWLNSAHNSRL